MKLAQLPQSIIQLLSVTLRDRLQPGAPSRAPKTWSISSPANSIIALSKNLYKQVIEVGTITSFSWGLQIAIGKCRAQGNSGGRKAVVPLPKGYEGDGSGQEAQTKRFGAGSAIWKRWYLLGVQVKSLFELLPASKHNCRFVAQDVRYRAKSGLLVAIYLRRLAWFSSSKCQGLARA